MTYVIVRMPDRDDEMYEPGVIGPFASEDDARGALIAMESDYPYKFSYTSGLGFKHEMTHYCPDYAICEVVGVGEVRRQLHEARKAMRS